MVLAPGDSGDLPGLLLWPSEGMTHTSPTSCLFSGTEFLVPWRKPEGLTFFTRDLSAAAEGLCPALGQGSGVKNVFSRPSRKWVTCKWLCPPDSRGFTPRGWEIYWTNTSLLFSIGTVCKVMNFGLSGRVGQETGPGADVSSVVLGMSVRQLLL